MTEHYCDAVPGVIIEELKKYRAEKNDKLAESHIKLIIGHIEFGVLLHAEKQRLFEPSRDRGRDEVMSDKNEKHDDRVARRTEAAKNILDLPISEYKISDSMCKDHERFFVEIDGMDFLTCSCKIVEKSLPSHYNMIGDALIASASNVIKLRARVAELEKERDALCDNNRSLLSELAW